MYLVRRRSDGKFYKNPDFHSIPAKYSTPKLRDREELWSENPSDCRPFKTQSGCRQSRAFRFYREAEKTYTNKATGIVSTFMGWEKIPGAFDEGYEIVEVTLQVRGSEY